MNPEAKWAYAAKWFMCAASIPCGLLLVALLVQEPPGTISEFLLNALIIAAAPVITAGVWGAMLGEAILDPAATRSMGRAALRGVGVFVASFLSYIFIVSLGLSALGLNSGEDSLKLFILLLVYGSVMVGWILCLVGALAGAQLYKRRVSADETTSS